jgi:hypothetical protein
LDEKRTERLNTSDRGYSVAAYGNKCKSLIYDRDGKQMRTFDAFCMAAQLYPQAASSWLKQLREISDRDILDLFQRIPNLGYCPRYLAADIYPLFQQNPELVRVTIDRVNQPPTPIQYRLLCRLKSKCDPGFQPFAGEDYQKLDSPLGTLRDRSIVAKLVSHS